MTNLPVIDKRLLTAVKYLRRGRVLCDVGTDHAYLPIYAVLDGISPAAVASDINEGPAERARLHVASYGIEDRIKVVRTDGLTGLGKYLPEDIVIFGMGGELIARIIDASPYPKNESVRLILQPMTCSDALRVYLAENGFDIIGETLSDDGDKIYVTICAEYSGVPKSLSVTERLFGAYNIESNATDPIFSRLVDRVENAYEVRRRGRSSAGLDVSEEDGVLAEIRRMKKELDLE